MNNWPPWQLKKIKIMEAVLSYSTLPIQFIHIENRPDGLNWQCCLARSSKMATRAFSVAMGTVYSFELILIETNAPNLFRIMNFS